jgi:hypothetical protein
MRTGLMGDFRGVWGSELAGDRRRWDGSPAALGLERLGLGYRCRDRVHPVGDATGQALFGPRLPSCNHDEYHPWSHGWDRVSAGKDTLGAGKDNSDLWG